LNAELLASIDAFGHLAQSWITSVTTVCDISERDPSSHPLTTAPAAIDAIKILDNLILIEREKCALWIPVVLNMASHPFERVNIVPSIARG
jgi:hypothetical protein